MVPRTISDRSTSRNSPSRTWQLYILPYLEQTAVFNAVNYNGHFPRGEGIANVGNRTIIRMRLAAYLCRTPVAFVSLVGWWALSRVMARLVRIPDVHKLKSSIDTTPIAPVPARLRDVRFREGERCLGGRGVVREVLS